MITKIGKTLLAKQEQSQQPGVPPSSYILLGGSGLLGGTQLIGKALASGDVTGRETLYHGTVDDAVASIKAKGVEASRDGATAHTHVLKRDPELYKASLGKTYFMPTKGEGALYAAQANIMKDYGLESPNLIDPYTGTQEFKRRTLTGKGVVKVNAPTWKMKSVINPEAAMPYDQWKYNNYERNPFMVDFTTEAQKKRIYNNLRRARVFEGDMPAEYVKGSAKYKGLTPKEFAEYAKANKLRFAKGLGKLTAGAGLAGLGAYGLYAGTKNASGKD